MCFGTARPGPADPDALSWNGGTYGSSSTREPILIIEDAKLPLKEETLSGRDEGEWT